MNKLFLAAGAALLLASCQQPSAVENTTSGIRMAYVRLDSLQSQYTYFQELNEEFAAEEQKVVAELQRRQQIFQENVELYQQEAPRMTERQRQMNEADLARVQQQYLQVEQAAQASLMKKQSELGTQLKEDMDAASTVLKDELNLDFILLYEENGQLLFANPEYDITARMVEVLNKRHEEAGDKEVATDSTDAE